MKNVSFILRKKTKCTFSPTQYNLWIRSSWEGNGRILGVEVWKVFPGVDWGSTDMFYLSTDWKIVSVSFCRNFLNVGNFPLSVGGLIHSWWTMAIFANKTKQNKANSHFQSQTYREMQVWKPKAPCHEAERQWCLCINVLKYDEQWLFPMAITELLFYPHRPSWLVRHY